MLRSSLCLLFTVAFASAVFAQRYNDVQSLQYEFGKSVKTQTVPAVVPCPCEKPVVYAPVTRGYYCAPVYTACTPCYTPHYVAPCYPVPKVYRRAFVRPMYHSPYYCW